MLSSWNRSFANLSKSLKEKTWSFCDDETCAHVQKHIESIPKLERDSGSGLIPKQMFWPPRVVRATKDESLLVFFGSGVSLAAGLPSWIGLLKKGGLDDDLEQDPHVSGDMLTLAELAAHTSGASTLQDVVRRALNTSGKSPTTAHNLLAALAQRFYITANYDTLFETAWHGVHGIEDQEDKKKSPIVVTTDDDIRREFGIDSESELDSALVAIEKRLRTTRNCVLFKVHGSVGRQHEYLVLTRSDYRRHYRTNRLLFAMVKKLMAVGQTLFLGFGHRDPEIIRLIDDVVHEYETRRSGHQEDNGKEPRWPGIYSLQFDMLQRTPEVFAARGIVALQPPLILSAPLQEVKGFQLAQGLTDLIYNSDHKIHDKLSLDVALGTISKQIDTEFMAVLKGMEDSCGDRALKALMANDKKEASQIAAEALASNQRFSNQGAYLVQKNGTILGLAVPDGLDKDWRLRKAGKDFGSRPFFRQATSLREPFVSDSFRSQFNGNSTLAFCLPLLERKQFAGLLFLAYQLRESDPLCATMFKMGSKATLLVVDSNGILLLPPEGEFGERTPVRGRSVPETPEANVGFDYDRLLYLSRRDKRVERISRSIVPLAQDDDVYPVALDTTVYTVLTELRSARWKIALTRFFPSKFEINV